MPIYDLSGDFVSDDVKFRDTVTISVERAAAPGVWEAEVLLRPAAEEALEMFRGFVYPYRFSNVTVTERASVSATDDSQC